MERLKNKIDLHKTYLNHILVIIVTVGAGVTNMFLKHDINVVFFVGVVVLMVFIATYGIMANKLNKELKDK
ncbi:MAG: hypothetical protein JJV95_04405 [Sulfurospirillum sp.]|nr:hypothetical protein [Sulfurospirillum sp.]